MEKRHHISCCNFYQWCCNICEVLQKQPNWYWNKKSPVNVNCTSKLKFILTITSIFYILILMCKRSWKLPVCGYYMCFKFLIFQCFLKLFAECYKSAWKILVILWLEIVRYQWGFLWQIFVLKTNFSSSLLGL